MSNKSMFFAYVGTPSLILPIKKLQFMNAYLSTFPHEHETSYSKKLKVTIR